MAEEETRESDLMSKRSSDTKSTKSVGSTKTTRSMASHISTLDDLDLDLFQLIPTEKKKLSLPKSNFVSLKQRLNKYSTYESLDCEQCHSQLWRMEYSKIEKYESHTEVVRWLIYIIIGLCTALADEILELLLSSTFRLKNYIILMAETEVLMYLINLTLDVVCAACGGLLCILEPAAIGSGYPQIKSYLNGVRMGKFFTFSAFLGKMFGTFFSDIGGTICSKPECMIHIGACIASTIWELFHCCKRTNVLKFFKNDSEKRNFILVGVTAGVAAGFGAPIGGVLVGLENTASVWNQDHVWKNLVAAAACTVAASIFLLYTMADITIIFGYFNLTAHNILKFELKELPIFILMGALGGLIGALFNAINVRVNLFRLRYLPKWWHRFLEVLIIVAFTSTMEWLMLSNFLYCKPIREKYFHNPVTVGCAADQYNIVGSFYIKQPGESFKWLLLAPYGEIPVFLLGVVGMVRFILMSITLGIYQSVGIINSVLLTGSSFGRILGEYLRGYTTAPADGPGKYALIGGAAFLGGVLRTPLSFTVILIEASDIKTPYIFALVVTLQTAQIVGDLFNDDLYERFARSTPTLPADSPPILLRMKAYDIMNFPVLCFKLQEKVSYISAVLNSCEHNAFPIVFGAKEDDRSSGRLVGLILRSQIMVILINGYFKERENIWINSANIDQFWDYQRTHPFIKTVEMHPKIYERNYTVDFTIFMNPAPTRVGLEQSAISIFRSFRGLSLRHIVVIDDDNKVIGIITRKDLSKF